MKRYNILNCTGTKRSNRRYGLTKLFLSLYPNKSKIFTKLKIREKDGGDLYNIYISYPF